MFHIKNACMQQLIVGFPLPQVSSASRNGVGAVGRHTEAVGQSAMGEGVAWRKPAVWMFMIRICRWRN
jgi:hypothetical protein